MNSVGHSLAWIGDLLRGLTLLISVLFFVLPISAQDAAPDVWREFGIQLTNEEVEWLRNHPVVRVSGDPAWPPYSSIIAGSGRFEGADVELFREVARRLGLVVTEVSAASWEEVWQKVSAGEVDVVTSTTPTPERAEQLLFTRPYGSMPVAIVARQDAPFMVDLRHLPPGTRAVGPSRYVTTERLALEIPGIPLQLTETSEEALQIVSRGDADFVVENLGVASHYIRRHRLTNLKIAGFTDDRFDLCLAVRKELPLLHSALDKALASISEAHRAQIMSNWLMADYSPGVRWRTVLTIAGIVLLMAALSIGAFAWHNQCLEREIKRRLQSEADLRSVNERLSTLNEEKTQFMRMAAHDLKNPLAGILTTIELLLMHQLNRSIDERTAMFLNEMQDNANRMLRLIRNLLDADAIERGQTNLRPQSVDLRSATRAVLKRFQFSATRKGIEFQCDSEDREAVPRIVADPDALARILDNLVSNAIKFSPNGGKVAIRISGPFSNNGDTTLRLTVCDGGPGIDQEDQAKLFDSQARLKNRPTDGEDSHGLGLSIVKRLCAAMGGSVWCESGPEGGACFVVELPAADVDAASESLARMR